MPLTAGLVVGGVAALGSGVMGYLGADEQAAASEFATKQQAATAEAARQQAQENAGFASTGIMGAGQYAGETIQNYGAQTIGEIQQGRDMALGQTLGYGGEAASSLAAGYGGAIGSQQAAVDLMGGLEGGSRYNALMADPSGYMAQDPGYQFRLQQSEQAINRANAAQGGRYSGRAAQELAGNAQNMASQEFGAAASRAQAADQASMARAGMQAGAYGGLASMQANAGQGMASQQTGMGDRLGSLFTGTGSQLANAYQGIGGNLANTATNTAAGVANAYAGASQQGTALAQSMIPQYANGVNYAGGGYNAIGNTIGQLGQLGMFAAGQSMGGGDFGADWAAEGNAFYR